MPTNDGGKTKAFYLKSVSIIVLCIGIYTLTNIGIGYSQELKELNKKYPKSIYIESVYPSKVIPSQEIVIYGYHFGDILNTDKRFQVFIDNQNLNGHIKVWQDQRIDIELPLSIKPGRRSLTIRRAVDIVSSNSAVIKSNAISIDVYSRFVILPAPNDSVFNRIIKRFKKILFLYIHIYPQRLFPTYN